MPQKALTLSREVDECKPLPLGFLGPEGAAGQGLTLVHFSAEREHFMSHVLGCFAGFSGKSGSG